MALATVEELIQEIQAGRMVIIMDDEDRENEGDLVMAASCVTPQAINFMVEYGRGLTCLTVTQQHADQLGLAPMVKKNKSPYSTNFTTSIEAAQGVTTGISAHDRAQTIQTAVKLGVSADDIVQPGHIFPIIAKEGGVLSRAGHTEAGCDLARLAGFEPAAAAIIEILNEDGTMARRDDLEQFAKKHRLKIGTIADLIKYRMQHETTIEQLPAHELETEFGRFWVTPFRDTITDYLHYSMQKGLIDSQETTLVRVHAYDFFTDIVGGLKINASAWTLRDSLRKVAQQGGVVVILMQDTPEKQLTRLHNANEAVDPARDIGVGSQILKALGVRKMNLLNSPQCYRALSGFGLEIVDFISGG